MTINDTELDFDLDIRENANRFAKAFQTLQRRLLRKAITDDDMENFLRGCLTRDQVNTLLHDGRLTTLASVFVSFFAQTIEQYKVVLDKYKAILETIESLRTDAESVIADYDAHIAKLDALQTGVGG